MLLAGAAHADPQFAPTGTWNVTPEPGPAGGQVLENQCPAGTTYFKDQFQSFMDGASGTASNDYLIDGKTVTVELTYYEDNLFDFQIINGVVHVFGVKAQDSLIYQYEPPVTGATNAGPVDHDTELHASTNRQGAYQDVSHLEFCLEPVAFEPLKGNKSANAGYDERHDWTLLKTVTPDAHSGNAGEEAGTSTWTVDVGHTQTDENFEVTGLITVINPNSVDVDVAVTDMLNDTTVATVSCPSNTVPALDSLICSYVANPADASATLNTATIESLNPDIEGATATAPVSFVVTVVGDPVVTVDDDRGPNPPFPSDISDSQVFNYDETFLCSSNPADYTNGQDEDTYVNIATVKGSSTDLDSKAEVVVTCTLPKLVANKTAEGTYDRETTWKIKKSASPAEHDGFAGDEFTSTWLVETDKSEVTDNYSVTGQIIIDNPAAIPQDFSVVDTMDDGTTANVSCPTNTVAAGGSVTCTYSASPADGSATLNTATVSAAGNGDQTATAGVSFTELLTGDDEVTIDDVRDTEGQFPIVISTSTDFDYDEKFTCSSVQSDYTNGQDEDIYPNTATLKGDNNDQSASAEVVVRCVLPALDVTKDAAGSYDRTVEWKVEKTANPVAHSGQAGQTFDSTWTVDVTKTEAEDNYSVVGNISIHNPAAIAQSFSSITDVLDDGTVATVDCSPTSIAAGATEVCPYTASPTDRSATLNTATVVADGNADQVATAAVSFTENLIGDDTVKVTDDRGPISEDISDSKTYVYDETFPCSNNPNDYTDGKDSDTYPNIAKLTGTNTNEQDDAQVVVDCVLPALTIVKTAAGSYDTTYDWTLEKTVTATDFAGRPGDTFSFDWIITVTQSVISDNYAVSGDITVGNPALIDQTWTSLVDELSDGTQPAVNCPTSTVGAGGSVVCTYGVAGMGGTVDANTATVTAPGNGPISHTVTPIPYTENVIGDPIVTVKDPRLGLEEILGGSKTFEIEETYTCGELGEFKIYNDSELLGQFTYLFDDAEVNILCADPGQASLEILDATITSATKPTGPVIGTFEVENASGDPETIARLGETTLAFESNEGRGVKVDHTATCDITPEATGFDIAPFASQVFAFECTVSPAISVDAKSIKTIVTIDGVLNQLNELRDWTFQSVGSDYRF